MMCENGVFKREHYVRTKNALIKFNKKFEQESNIIMMKEEVNETLRKDTNILGFEDVRLFVDDNKLKCIGTSREYNNINDTNAMVILDYDNENNEMKNINIIVPPMPDVKECQKNWIPVDDKIIYKWHPLQIGVIKNSKLFLIKSLDTPKFFKHLRGSSNVFKYNKFILKGSNCLVLGAILQEFGYSMFSSNTNISTIKKSQPRFIILSDNTITPTEILLLNYSSDSRLNVNTKNMLFNFILL